MLNTKLESEEIYMAKKGLFIVLEGGEGVGKTTLAKSLKNHFESLGREVVLTREPGGVDTAENIRNLIMRNQTDSLSEALLFAAARREHLLKKVVPALESDKIVICDRFVGSSIVYQGIVGNADINTILNINKAVIGDYIPDITLVLQMDIEEALNRIHQNNRETNRFDNQSLEYHKSIEKAYARLDSFSIMLPLLYINAAQSPEDVFKESLHKIKRIMN